MAWVLLFFAFFSPVIAWAGSNDGPVPIGNWTSQCAWLAAPAAGPTSVGGHFVQVAYQFKDGKFTQTVSFHTEWDGYCQMQPAMQTIISGNYTLGSELPGIQHARQIDFISTSALYVPLSPDQVSSLNAIAYCGVTDWTLGKATEVLGKVCNFNPEGEPIYQIFQVYLVDGKRQMFLGLPDQTHDSRTPATRPYQLNLDGPLYEQGT